MIRLGFGVRTLSETRLSISPAMEAVAWLKLAATGRRHPVFGDPGPLARGVLRHPDVALVADLLSAEEGRYSPDLLTPRPGTGSWKEILHTQLAEIEATGQGDVDAQVLSGAGEPPERPLSRRVRRLAESGRLQRRLAAGLDRFWRETLHDGWPSLQSVLDNDIAERSKAIAGHGVGRMLDGIHPRVGWSGEVLTIDSPYDEVIDLSGHGLVLAPTVLNGTDLLFQIETTLQTVAYYPAGRKGATGRRDPAELTEVVGTVRAVLLADLGVARSTTELAGRHSVAASTVSYHLGALHRAGLVARRRDGRHVLYRRTRRADVLIEPS